MTRKPVTPRAIIVPMPIRSPSGPANCEAEKKPNALAAKARLNSTELRP